MKLAPRTRQVFAWNSIWVVCEGLFCPKMSLLGAIFFMIYGLISFLAWQPIRNVTFMAADVMCSLLVIILMLIEVRENIWIMPILFIGCLCFSYSSFCKNKGYEWRCTLFHLFFRVSAMLSCIVVWGHFADLSIWRLIATTSLCFLIVFVEVARIEYDSNHFRESMRTLPFVPFLAYLVNPMFTETITNVTLMSSTCLTLVIFYGITYSQEAYVKIHDGDQFEAKLTREKMLQSQQRGYGSFMKK